MKTPFSNIFFKEAISDLINLYWTVKGQSKKLLVLDLDDTIWGGIVGEVGWKNLRIGGHDYIGEAFQDFQKKIKSLKESGIILAIASKNEESIAIEAINKHPEMILSMNDFVIHRINWQDKAKNIAEMVNELNLGLESGVFFVFNLSSCRSSNFCRKIKCLFHNPKSSSMASTSLHNINFYIRYFF